MRGERERGEGEAEMKHSGENPSIDDLVHNFSPIIIHVVVEYTVAPLCTLAVHSTC